MRTEYRVFPFEPGQVIAYRVDQYHASSKPLTVAYAVVLSTSDTRMHQSCEGFQVEYQHEWLTVMPLAAGRARRMKAHNAAHAGWCAVCAVPAHQAASGGLRCPRCAGPCAEPPPDLWIVRNFPEHHDYSARIIAQSLRTPQLSQHAIWKLLDEISNTRRRAFHKQFHVDPYTLGEETRRELDRCAITEDAARYAEVLARVERRTAGFRALIDLVKMMGDRNDPLEDDCLIARPADMPADDRTPDGEDSVTRWLAGQVVRHERRAKRAA